MLQVITYSFQYNIISFTQENEKMIRYDPEDNLFMTIRTSFQQSGVSGHLDTQQLHINFKLQHK